MKHVELEDSFLQSYDVSNDNPNVFVRSWNTEFSAIWIGVWLSQYNLIGHSGEKSSSVNKSLIQIMSQVTFTIAWYSDSVLNRDITHCFLLFYNTTIPLRNTQKPMVDYLLTGDLPINSWKINSSVSTIRI